ncbi:outer membrane lipoprotein carrier protein LolA [Paenibacillus thiaminolyticus]|uniref:outer membrane lipoprotein-sorting protein n=1 Tax=Paenibacillus thiaminolyticus TaxID=49283 RepID=UPI003D2D9C78
MIIRIGLCILLVASFLLSGCQNNLGFNLSGEQIVDKVLESGKESFSYYGESLSITYENGKEKDSYLMKEWLDGESDRMRLEVTSVKDSTVTVNDGRQFIVWDQTGGEAFRMSVRGDSPPLTQREQMKQMLEKLQATHDFETVGEEKVGEWNTIHFKAIARQKDDLFQRMELWIDPKTWMMLKTVFESGPVRSESIYTKLDMSPNFGEDTFKLDIPEGIPVLDLDPSMGTRNVTLAEAEEALGRTFLQCGADGVKLMEITMYYLQENFDRTEFSLNYWKDDKPYLTLSVSTAPPAGAGLEPEYGMEKIEVRGQTGIYDDSLHTLWWNEDGLRYTLMPEMDSMTKEQMLSIAGQLR